ncbi:AbgT family transporter [Corynebacterium sp. 320]|uniref:AbgT family transporter n=1 Tax=Corynebacterium TaxID=1716 RepID=UPI00125CAFB3|nr:MULTISPECIES: AbgT family transporter [Corynebacterium]KAB1503152.1 AbgT family transporter [Corynebacterium sp. 320]KAB1550634.1 AbgT family transporter [Corynebacterium sp. 321]KAB1550996.1 AbgT family transporter [Corynebacterium sp. 319]KAB3526949.1 AbgT family transporter [Corynebacterium sp. 250]KAB3538442.1 AbgT family transporter [Corynebacterium sp. 366]
MSSSTASKKSNAEKTDAKDHDQKKPPEAPGGFLGTIEKIGNKLPNPFWLFVFLAGIVAVASWIGSSVGMSATDPESGDPIEVTNLLTSEGLSKMVTEAVNNFISFPPLGVILAVMLGVAVAEQTGLLSALVRAMVARVSPKMLTFVLALAGVTGSVASDAIYVILIPLGAMAFHAVGRSPIVGAMVAFAASSAGFNASLILNITDLLLAGISTKAAHIVDPDYTVNALANIFFVVPSAIVLSLIITAVTELFIVRKARELVDHDDLDTSSLSFSDEDADGNADEDYDFSEDEEELSLKPIEARGLAWAGVALLVFLAVFFALIFVPGSPFAGPDGEFMESPLIQAIAVPIALGFFVVGAVYGLKVGTITSAGDVPDFMAKGLQSLLPMIVLFFMVAQFLAWFDWSNLGVWTAIKGSELLQAWNLPPLVMFAGLVLMVALLNLFITSGSAQWALMAPVVVPMLMYVNISPEVAQMLFRIGDSPTNIITPMSPYFALALTFLQRYYKRAGVGTLMSLALPYSLTMLAGWFVFFVVWYLLGIPLGPGVSMHYPAG